MASFVRRFISQGGAVIHPEPIRPLFQSSLVRIGSFRCPVNHPRFYDSGPTRSHLFVFPRNCVWIEQEGRRPFVSDPTHAVLYNPRHLFNRRPISRDGDRSDWFGVTADLHREIQASFEPRAADELEARFPTPQARVDAATYRMQRSIFAYVAEQREPDAMAIEEAVIDVLHRLLSGIYQQKATVVCTPQRHADLVEAARAHLAAHFASKQTLKDVAGALGCSVFHLCRVFRRHTGMTLHAYRQQLRVRHALETVTSGRADLLDVALALGYSGHSHFTAAFRAAFGAPPSAMRAGGANLRF